MTESEKMMRGFFTTQIMMKNYLRKGCFVKTCALLIIS